MVLEGLGLNRLFGRGKTEETADQALERLDAESQRIEVLAQGAIDSIKSVPGLINSDNTINIEVLNTAFATWADRAEDALYKSNIDVSKIKIRVIALLNEMQLHQH